MKNQKIYKLSLTAMFTALVFVATYFIAIPMPAVGYVNLGDAFIILCTFIIGPVCGAVCGGIGAMLADLMLGYAIYAPATIIIKSLMAIACYFVYKLVSTLTKHPFGFILGGFVAELVMVLGYFLFEGVFLIGFAGAIVNIPFNSIQGFLSIIVANILANILFANKTIRKYMVIFN
ncbi:MAG: ECF transporter S component [Clostridia bacterium]|nr:ECF transporter S component [Clostridia bacterium]